MLGTGVVAFGVATTLPDATQWPVRQVVELVESSLAPATQTAATAAFLIHQSQPTRRDDSLQSLLKHLGIEDLEAQDFLARDATARLLLAGASGKLASVYRA